MTDQKIPDEQREQQRQKALAWLDEEIEYTDRSTIRWEIYWIIKKLLTEKRP